VTLAPIYRNAKTDGSLLNTKKNSVKMAAKRTPPTPTLSTVYNVVLEGRSPYELVAEKGYSKNQIKRAITKLRGLNIVAMKKKRVWYFLPHSKTDLKMSGRTHVAPSHPPTLLPNADRLHGLRISVRVPASLAGWTPRAARAQKLSSLKVRFKEIPQGQAFTFGDVRVWLCDRSIVLQFKRQFIAQTAPEALRQSMTAIKSTVEALERYLGVNSFAHGGRYITKMTRAHHSLIKNALAADLDDRGVRLWQFRDNGGVLWGQFDKSAGAEIDILSPNAWDNARDHRIFQNLFNYVRDHPGKIENTTEGISGEFKEAFHALAVQIETHLAATNTWHTDAKELGTGITSWNAETMRLSAATRSMGEVMRGLKRELSRMKQKDLRQFVK
jgi:hypothetical protein